MEKSPLLLIKTVFKNLKFQVHTVTMYVKFNEEIKVVQKKLMDFQNQNMQAMNAAQQAKDTAVITNLMKGYSDIQAEVGAATKTKYTTYAESHPKSYQCFNCTRDGKRP
jgi:hypothetical protein